MNIGDTYIPEDNTFAYCLENGKNYRLAGHDGNGGKVTTKNFLERKYVVEETTVVTLPYIETVTNGDREYTFTFIIVRCKRDLLHRVLFK